MFSRKKTRKSQVDEAITFVKSLAYIGKIHELITLSHDFQFSINGMSFLFYQSIITERALLANFKAL